MSENKLLFKNVFATDIDLSYTGIIHAAEQFRINEGREPTLVWCNGYEPEYIAAVERVLREKKLPYHIQADRRLAAGSWCIGDLQSFGFGSAGA